MNLFNLGSVVNEMIEKSKEIDKINLWFKNLSNDNKRKIYNSNKGDKK